VVASEQCPRCAERRVGAFRYCRTCGLDYDGLRLGRADVAPRRDDIPPPTSAIARPGMAATAVATRPAPAAVAVAEPATVSTPGRTPVATGADVATSSASSPAAAQRATWPSSTATWPPPATTWPPPSAAPVEPLEPLEPSVSPDGSGRSLRPVFALPEADRRRPTVPPAAPIAAPTIDRGGRSGVAGPTVLVASSAPAASGSGAQATGPGLFRMGTIVPAIAMALAAILVVWVLATRIAAPSSDGGTTEGASSTAVPGAPASGVGLGADAPGASGAGGVGGSIERVIVSNKAIIVTAGEPARFTGESAAYAWRSLTFEDDRATVSWEVTAPAGSACRMTWQFVSDGGVGPNGRVEGAEGSSDEGAGRYDIPFREGSLAVSSTCARWTLSVQGVGD
jgi:hypothetical protein